MRTLGTILMFAAGAALMLFFAAIIFFVVIAPQAVSQFANVEGGPQ